MVDGGLVVVSDFDVLIASFARDGGLSLVVTSATFASRLFSESFSSETLDISDHRLFLGLPWRRDLICAMLTNFSFSTSARSPKSLSAF